MYSKILVGVAYQSSIFDLKYIVGFYFSTNFKKSQSSGSIDEFEFTRRRKRTEILMSVWFYIIFVYFVADLIVNYIYLYFYSNFDSNTKPDNGESTVFLKVTYYFVGLQFLILTVLIIWQTFALINIIKVMGTRLAKEQSRLRKLMFVFAISYFGTSAYYILQVLTNLPCTKSDQCVRFNDFILRCCVQLFFDIIPISYLYYQHYHTSMESVKQHSALNAKTESLVSGSGTTVIDDQYTSTDETGSSSRPIVRMKKADDLINIIQKDSVGVGNRDQRRGDFETVHLDNADSSSVFTYSNNGLSNQNKEKAAKLMTDVEVLSNNVKSGRSESFLQSDTVSMGSIPATLVGTIVNDNTFLSGRDS